MLNSASLVGFIATAHPETAKHFYGAVLGLDLIEDGPFALVFNANGTMLRVQKVEHYSAPAYTVLGWVVRDIRPTVHDLATRGVEFQRYDGMPQDEDGIWRTPNGSSVAWFHDPEGNTLSLLELLAQPA